MTRRETRTGSREKEIIGWLVMQKVDGSGKDVLSVYKQDMSIYLVRQLQTGPSEHLVRGSNEASADGWMLEATVVWYDLTVKGSEFRSFLLGRPD